MRCGKDVCIGVVMSKEGRINWLKKVRNLEVNGKSGRGRQCKTWEQVEDLCAKGLRREVTQNHDLQLHEQSNQCLHGLIVDFKMMMMMMNIGDLPSYSFSRNTHFCKFG